MSKKLIARARDTWIIVGVTLLLLLAVELLAHLAVFVRLRLADDAVDLRIYADTYKGADWAPAYFKELHSMPGFKWHPYVYWRRVPFKGTYTNIDERGLRKTWSATHDKAPSKAKRLRIFMFGGSTLWGTGARDEQTIPSIVAKLLVGHDGLNVEVTNFGASAYITTQEVVALVRELQAGNLPDLVIFYDGVNDTFGTFQRGGVAGLPQNESNRMREFNLLLPENSKRLYKESLLMTVSNSATYQVLRSLVRRATGHDLPARFLWNNDSFTEPPIDRVANETARTYAWNVGFVKSISATYGFESLFYWQPAIFSKDQLTAYEQKVRKTAKDLEGYYEATTNRVKAALPNTDKFHDISGIFKGDGRPHFIDGSHIGEAGNEAIARRMLRDIVPVTRKLGARAGKDD